VVHPAGSGGDSSRRERAVRTQDEIQPALLAGDEDLQVVGESFRQDNLRHLTGYPPPEKYVEEEIRAVLVAEKDNPYDPNAIAVWIKDPQAGTSRSGTSPARTPPATGRGCSRSNKNMEGPSPAQASREIPRQARPNLTCPSRSVANSTRT